ncbi:MAG: CusA/CzcA family heavy metal efflux RND transporter [Sphingobium sp.]|nr:CusA/CzcA family heavy metal efflux RND transporter [Sphingobium sp.]
MFRAIVGFSLANRLLVIALAAALALGGLIAANRLPVDVFPDLNRTTVTVMTEVPSLAAEETESLITIPVEAALGGLPGTLRLRSSSVAGLSIVYVDFDFGVNVLASRQQVSERLATLVGTLPSGAEPRLAPISSIMGEVMLVAVTGADPMQLRELADFTLRPKLLAIPGVAQVVPIGGAQRQYLVKPRAQDMRAQGVTLAAIEAAVSGFASNAGGGFVDQGARELSLRAVTRTTDLARLAAVPVAGPGGILRLDQLADVTLGARPRRGDGEHNGASAVILSIAKQPHIDTLALTRGIEAVLKEAQRSAPPGVRVDRVQFRQADFVETSVANVRQVLVEALMVVAVVLFAFLLSARATAISLLAIPLSVLATAIVFALFDIGINTMTLGGIAIAIGELVDDAVVDVENIVRRLRENQTIIARRSVIGVIAEASQEVRSGIVYATAIIILVFVPLFALGGIEGQLFRPLGLAYVISILASLIVAITITPVLASLLLPATLQRAGRESPLVRAAKAGYARLLDWAWPRERLIYMVAGTLFALGLGGALMLPRAFLPPFNEGSFTVNLQFQPGISLAESAHLGAIGERLLLQVPGIASVGRRTGRGELDEHAEGVHYGEYDVQLRPGNTRHKHEVAADIRAALAPLPGSVNVGQPIGHRLEHLISGVRAEIAIKFYGEDLDTLRQAATALEDRLRAVSGLSDVQIERITRVPQIDVRIRPEAASAYGIAPARVADAFADLTAGKILGQVIDGLRRYDVVVRLDEAARAPTELAQLPIDTPGGPVQLGALADVVEVAAPNQYVRENGRRRLALIANTNGRQSQQAIIAAIEHAIAALRLPTGVSVALEGNFEAEREAARTIGLLSLVSLALIFALLVSRYRSPVLALIIIGSVPLALVGSVAALALAGQPLSVASMVGFVTLAGIATRNGILKLSHWLNLILHEGRAFDAATLTDGALDRVAPVLMTALSAGLALLPLVVGAEAPGKEILHPVALTILGGLFSSTLLDAVVTPLLFRRFARPALDRLATANAGVPTAAVF